MVKKKIENDTKTRYSDADLKEFRELIMGKLQLAKDEFHKMQKSLQNPNENGAKWWSASTAPPQEPALLSKPQSPFGPLWGDFHADVKPK